jgi:transcriptional regulator with XRE-family HTH domain
MLSKKRFSEIVGKNVKKARLEKEFSQEELADKSGFYRTYVNLVETARRTPSSYSLYRLAKALGVSTGSLFPSSD